jgi:hypothetical protein
MRKYKIVFMLSLIKHVAFSFKIITMENRGNQEIIHLREYLIRFQFLFFMRFVAIRFVL